MWPNPNYQFEFAQPPFAWQALRWPGGLLVVVLGVLVAVQYTGLTETEAQLQRLAQRQQQLMQQQAGATAAEHQPATKVAVKQPVAVLSQPQQKVAEKIVQQLNVRWFDLLQALESRQVPDIALLQLLPDANRGQFVLSGEAKSYQDLLKYVSQLQAVPTLNQVHLQKHQVNESHPQRPVSFEIQGGWQP